MFWSIVRRASKNKHSARLYFLVYLALFGNRTSKTLGVLVRRTSEHFKIVLPLILLFNDTCSKTKLKATSASPCAWVVSFTSNHSGIVNLYYWVCNRARKSRVYFAWRYEICGIFVSLGTLIAQPRFWSHVKSMGDFSLLQIIAI